MKAKVKREIIKSKQTELAKMYKWIKIPMWRLKNLEAEVSKYFKLANLFESNSINVSAADNDNPKMEQMQLKKQSGCKKQEEEEARCCRQAER